ncbi:hypothetical protein QLX52_30590 [Streptomyces albus]|uniref:hypothetical protein n=1 Tax=Streptomyces albus TaxID=1888 RepID=UPI0024AC8AE7|nr:hypothetical protein [Streptomyces albus]MDI6413158.1 hypothetical protein [Streptomyces albus]
MSTQSPSASPEVSDEELLAGASRLESCWYTGPRLWHGTSGESVTGARTAAFLETAAGLLEREGWEPGQFGLREVLAGPQDLTDVSLKVLELVICARTGAGSAEPRLWDRVPGRTVAEVRALLLAGAAYARRYGPA